MHIALITPAPVAFDVAAGHGRSPLVAGRSVLQHQVDFALLAGCQRVICLAEDRPQDFDRVQRACTEAGAHMRLLHRPRDLSTAITAESRVLVFGPNVLVEPELLSYLPKNQATVLTLPADSAVALGFERIDATRAWAGVMLLPGQLVEELHKLPEDTDAVSALLRIALMAGTPMVELPPHVLSHGTLALPLDAAAMRRIEEERLRRRVQPVRSAAPLTAAVERLTLRHGVRLAALTHDGTLLLPAGGVLLLVALMASQRDHTAAALVAILLCCAALTAWRLLRAAARTAAHKSSKVQQGVGLIADLTLAAILAKAGAVDAAPIANWYPPLMLLGLLHAAGRYLPPKPAQLMSDRIALVLLMLGTHAAGMLTAAVMLLSLMVSMLLIYETHRTKITPN